MESSSKTFDLKTGRETSVPSVRSAEDIAAETARTAHLNACEAIRLQLVADLGTQPVGVQVFFRPTADTVRALLQRGNLETAREVIATTPLHGDAALEAVRDLMLTRFPAG